MKFVRILFAVLLFAAALAVSGAAVAVCRTAPDRQAVFLTDPPDPSLTVSAFFDEICAGDFSGACGYLNGCTDLGLQKQPEDVSERLVHDALINSYSYSLTDGGERHGVSATERVDFTALDVTALMDGLGDEINALLAAKVEQAVHAEEVYDDSGSFREAVVMEAYDEALGTRLDNASDYCSTVSLTVELSYSEQTWFITPDSQMLSALSGVPEGQVAE